MSVAPAEGVHTPQPPNDAAVAEFNADLMDGSTVNGVGSKQSMNDNAGDEVTAQSSLEDASTKPGATEDKLESFSGSQGLHEAEIPSVPHKEIAIDGSSTEEAFLEHPAPELTPARIENHELAADIATEDKDDVAVEETAPAPESPASLLADADASTIDHASTMTGINDPASSATEMAAVEDASGAPPQQSEALISDAEDTKETSIHPAAVEVAGEEVPEGDPVPAHPAEQETTDHAPVETAPITHATEDGVVDEEHAEASILNEETTPEVASTAIAEEPTPALSAPSEVAPVEEKTSETTPAPLEPPSVTDLASQAAVEEDPILEEDVATEVPSEVVADDLVVEAAPVSDSASPDSTETLNEVAPIAPEILVEPSGSEEALETVDATISSTEPQVSEEQLVSTITRDASPSAGLIDHSAAEDGTFEEEIIEPPTSIEVSILDEDQAQADELAPVDGGIPSEPIVFEAESSFTAPVIEAPISSSPAIQEEEETPAQDPSDAVEVPAVLDVPAEISSVEPITGSSEVTVDLLGDSQEEETMDAPAESPFAETLSVPLKLSDESVQEIVLPEKPEPSIVEPHDDVAESPLFSSFIKPDKPGALDIPSTEADTASASDGPTDVWFSLCLTDYSVEPLPQGWIAITGCRIRDRTTKVTVDPLL
ncbi:hypothetical protein C8R46DRAFT_401180 [Mycena filopes]|nr:hypothetical protein C8R46DRAFT_401180 [Mycena filopes]